MLSSAKEETTFIEINDPEDHYAENTENMVNPRILGWEDMP